MSAASETIYLDYAATAPLAPGVMEVMQHALMATDANPASLHGPGREAARLIDTAAAEVAQLINAREKDLIWTSGATESINLALKGVVAFAGTDAHIVSVVTEHSATLDTLAWLEKYGTRVTRLPVDSDGRIDLGDLESALADNATLVSIMHVNNETGVIQDIAAIGERCAAHGVDLHVDAAQSLGRLALDVERMQIALLSLSAHKIGGPKGVGALYVRPRTGLAAQLHGGGQQRGAVGLFSPLVWGLGHKTDLTTTGWESLLAPRVEKLPRLADEARFWLGLGLLLVAAAGLMATATYDLPFYTKGQAREATVIMAMVDDALAACHRRHHQLIIIVLSSKLINNKFL